MHNIYIYNINNNAVVVLQRRQRFAISECRNIVCSKFLKQNKNLFYFNVLPKTQC